MRDGKSHYRLGAENIPGEASVAQRVGRVSALRAFIVRRVHRVPCCPRSTYGAAAAHAARVRDAWPDDESAAQHRHAEVLDAEASSLEACAVAAPCQHPSRLAARAPQGDGIGVRAPLKPSARKGAPDDINDLVEPGAMADAVARIRRSSEDVPVITNPTVIHISSAPFTGARPGEALRCWRDVKPAQRIVEIPVAKASNAIRMIMSAPIARILKRARDIGNGDLPEVLTPDDFVFPHCGQIAARDALRAIGHALPHTYRTLAADCGIDDILSHVLFGPHAAKRERAIHHAACAHRGADHPRGATQSKVSQRIIELLKADPTQSSRLAHQTATTRRRRATAHCPTMYLLDGAIN